MTRIEAVAVVPAAVPDVWSALLNHERWPEWRANESALYLGAVEPVDGALTTVGDRRRCTAVLDRLPLVGHRHFSWEERITDIAEARTLELETCNENPALRRWRVRVWLAAQTDGQTRIRCQVSYTPATLSAWLADLCILRRRIELAVSAWLSAIAASFAEEPAHGCDIPPSQKEISSMPSAPVAA